MWFGYGASTHRDERWMIQTRPQFEGATKQQTYEFTPNQPDQPRYDRLSQFERSNTRPPVRVEGLVDFQTIPVPPVTTRADAWFGYGAEGFRDARRLLQAVPRFEGATVHDTFEFFPSQPDQQRYEIPRQAWRTLTTPPGRFEGATSLQTFPIPPTTTIPAEWFRQLSAAVNDILRRSTGPTRQLDGATTQQTYEFVPHQPELLRFQQGIESHRFLVPVVLQLDGPTLHQTYEFTPNQPEFIRFTERRDLFRCLIHPPTRTEGPTDHQTYEFFPGQPEIHQYMRLIQQLRWMTTPAVDFTMLLPVETYEFFPNQPEQLAYRKLNTLRYLIDVAPRVEGATNQELFEFFPGQPEFIRLQRGLDVQRFLVPAVPQLDGPTSHQTYEFAPGQPETQQYDQVRQQLRWLTAPVIDFSMAQPAETYEFLLSQPEPLAYLNRQALRYLINVAPRVEGATDHPLFEFFPGQPDLRRYETLAQQLRHLVGTNPPLSVDDTQLFIYPTKQPELIRWSRRDLLRHIVNPVPQFAGSNVPEVWPFAVNQPDFRRFYEKQPVGARGPWTWITFEGKTLPCLVIALRASDSTSFTRTATDDTDLLLLAVDGTVFLLKGRC